MTFLKRIEKIQILEIIKVRYVKKKKKEEIVLREGLRRRTYNEPEKHTIKVQSGNPNPRPP